MPQFPLSSNQKVPFVCFICRAAIKLPPDFYWEEIGPRVWTSKATPKCPTCQKPMVCMDRYFKVPPRSALNQWRKAELLWRNGWVADGYSGSPRTLRDARELLQKPSSEAMTRAASLRANNEKRWRLLRAKRHRSIREPRDK